MDIAEWPIVKRTQLVQAFRPGEEASREGPFRTLRSHRFATAGVSVVTRTGPRAEGRVTLFSCLNVDAARLARHGEERAARAMAKIAGEIEGSHPFERLVDLLKRNSAETISCVLDGTIPEAMEPHLMSILRELASETTNARSARVAMTVREIVAGTISEAHSNSVVLEGADGLRTLVPRPLARAAHREAVGDCLALITDQLDERRAIVEAVPGIAIEPTRPRFSPFRRAAVHPISMEDARFLAGDPQPLKILIPVTIGS